MGIRFTRRRAFAGLAIVVAVGAIGGAVALTVAKKSAARIAEAKAKAAPTLEFGRADLAFVESKPLARWLQVSGTLQPVHQAMVKAKVAAEVRQIGVREGEAVKAGQPIARLDTADLEARLVERMGALESARAQLALAEKTRTMNNRLLRENFISQNAFDGSESSFNVAQGGVKSSEAQVRLAQNALKDALVTAPIAGIVAKRHVQPGEKLAFDSPIVTIVDLSQLELAALVPAMDVPELRVGMTVDLAVDGFGERRFAGRVERISPSTEPGTRAIHVYVGLQNAEATLKGGMFSSGRIELSTSTPVATLPLSAVRQEAGQSFVWTIESGKLVRRTVLTGRRDDDAGVVEVKTPLPAGVPVLSARFDNLKDGAPAIVRAPSPSSSAGSLPPAPPAGPAS